jgi:hypothetical protein
MVAESMVVARRQGVGLPPAAIGDVVGRRAREPIAEGTLLSMDLLA